MAVDPRGPKEKPKLDEFTAAVVPDPMNPRGALVVTGFLGASSDAKRTRIYFDASCNTYVDVETADILHSQPLSEGGSGLGGSCVWLNPEAQVSYGSTGVQAAKGKFFEGPLMAAYGGQVGPGTPVVGQGGAPFALTGGVCTRPAVCRQRTNLCFPSVLFNCPSVDSPCGVSYDIRCSFDIRCWGTPAAAPQPAANLAIAGRQYFLPLSLNAYCTYDCGSLGGGGCTVGAVCGGQTTGMYCWG